MCSGLESPQEVCTKFLPIDLQERAWACRDKTDIVAHVLDSCDALAIGQAAESERARSFPLRSRHSGRSWFH